MITGILGLGRSCVKQPHVLTPERFNIPNPQPHHVAIVGHRALGNNVELKFFTTGRIVRTLRSGDIWESLVHIVTCAVGDTIFV